MDLPVKPAPKTNPRIDLDPNLFKIQIHSMGWRLWWEQAEACPCKESLDSDAGRMGCPVCGGRGWTWHSGQEIRGLVTRAQQIVQPFERIGEWAKGGIMLTLEPEHLPGMFDRFRAMGAVFRMREIVVSTGTVDQLRYPVARRELALQTGTVTVGVLRARAEAADGSASTSTLAEGVDFDVDLNGNIAWRVGHAPPAGRRVFFDYTAHPVFEAMEDSYSTRTTRNRLKKHAEYDAPLVVLVACKLKYGNIRV